MPFTEVTRMESRQAFVELAIGEEANIRALCRQFEISPTTAYAWLARYAEAGTAGLAEQSRRPHTSPRQTPPAVEAAVVELRQQQPARVTTSSTSLVAGIINIPAATYHHLAGLAQCQRSPSHPSARTRHHSGHGRVVAGRWSRFATTAPPAMAVKFAAAAEPSCRPPTSPHQLSTQ